MEQNFGRNRTSTHTGENVNQDSYNAHLIGRSYFQPTTHPAGISFLIPVQMNVENDFNGVRNFWIGNHVVSADFHVLSPPPL